MDDHGSLCSVTYPFSAQHPVDDSLRDSVPGPGAGPFRLPANPRLRNYDVSTPATRPAPRMFSSA
ncbi:hypothetical protein FMEAI12_6180002 [Parafrankia sp. Ea1.12]|nr:hypothetical protein FMEAI12_6180002 [Parafrankia sp. Ea1.12]